MKNLRAFLLSALLLLGLCVPASAAESGVIVILGTNDVHCGMERKVEEDGTVSCLGVEGVAAYRKEMEAQYGEENVTLVDSGDAIQGEAIGTLSDGELPVELMDTVGYDFAIPGNHEFDYGMDRFLAISEQAGAEYLCCNLIDTEGEPLLSSYAVADYGETQVAYVGVTTPEGLTTSNPANFQNEQGEYIYSLCEGEGELYHAVQGAVDAARADGADYVVLLAHLGQDGSTAAWRSDTVVANTTGVDVVLDGHSHEQYIQKAVNKAGEEVPLVQTGTKLAAMSKVTIDPAAGTVNAELVKNYAGTDADAAAKVGEINAELAGVLQEEVASTDVPLTVNDPDTGERAVRTGETNLGDLVADAYRVMLGADIGLANGGGVRADIDAGPITYEEIIAVQPFGNMMCLSELSGQQILDALEMGAREYPQENGGFLQVSGLTYAIDPNVGSTVKVDDKGAFISVEGARRVYDVKVGGEPIQAGKTYTVACHDYYLKSGGDGFSMLKEGKLLQEEVMLDNQALIRCITEKLDGVVGEDYADPRGQGRIVIAAQVSEKPTEELMEKPEEKPTEEPVEEPEIQTGPASNYTVQKGDSLWRIAQK